MCAALLCWTRGRGSWVGPVGQPPLCQSEVPGPTSTSGIWLVLRCHWCRPSHQALRILPWLPVALQIKCPPLPQSVNEASPGLRPCPPIQPQLWPLVSKFWNQTDLVHQTQCMYLPRLTWSRLSPLAQCQACPQPLPPLLTQLPQSPPGEDQPSAWPPST